MNGTQNTITKQDIDKWFTDNYKDIEIAIDYQISYYLKKHKKKPLWERDTLITNAYEYLLLKKDVISERNSNIKAFFRAYVRFEAMKFNSKINKMDREHEKMTYVDEVYDYEDDYSDLEDKIQLEKLYNLRMSTLSKFFLTLNKEEQILYDVIYNRKINSISKLSNHFNINKNMIIKKRTELNNKLKIYIDEHYK